MKARKFFMFLWWVIIASVPALAQDKLYPVRGSKDVSVILTPDRSGFVVEKAFEHKLIVAFPTDDNISFIPDTREQIIVLWLRIQNVSQRPIQLDIAKFTSADDEGRIYSGLAPDEAANRIIAAAAGGSIGTKTLRGISLGRVANKPTDEQIRENIQRYSIHSGEIAAGAVKQGLIFFERPAQKNFTVRIALGNLWSQPLVFSTAKQK